MISRIRTSRAALSLNWQYNIGSNFGIWTYSYDAYMSTMQVSGLLKSNWCECDFTTNLWVFATISVIYDVAAHLYLLTRTRVSHLEVLFGIRNNRVVPRLSVHWWQAKMSKIFEKTPLIRLWRVCVCRAGSRGPFGLRNLCLVHRNFLRLYTLFQPLQ